MTHAHITTWVIALILFFVAIALHKKESKRAYKIVVMILRVFYLLIIATGAMLLFSLATITGMYWVKALLGLLVIGFLEMVLSFSTKGKSAGVAWILLIVGFIAVVYLGFDLPMGF
ncbi:YisL family protein [Niallia sp. Krafla_26]|uniref:YisL family protein n=1 Tax=Niallia sp. Krafla_26 TaxID=3064703 RepID=UPI003D181A1E